MGRSKKKKKKRGDTTMEVELGELREPGASAEIGLDAFEEKPRKKPSRRAETRTPSEELDASLDDVLGELEEQVEVEPTEPQKRKARSVRAKSSIPPPLPARKNGKRVPTGSVKLARAPARRSAPPPPPGSARRSAPPLPPGAPPGAPPPPLPRARPPTGASKRVRGLGKPGGAAPARSLPTAPGVASPLPAQRPLPPSQSVVEESIVSDDVSAPAPRRTLEEIAAELATEWKAELKDTKDKSRIARLRYELGRLYEGPLKDRQEALAHYTSALESMRDHLPSLRGARRSALALKSFRSALPFFDAEARITSDPRRKASLLFAKGRVLEDALGEVEQARNAYQTAAELDRDSPAILKALEQRDRATDDWAKLERTLEREANAVASDPRHRAALVLQRARVLEHREQKIDAALELYETALRLDPDATGALEALERLCHSQGRWRDLIRVLTRGAEASTDAAERALGFYRVGRLHAERLGNRDEAAAALARAVEAQPHDPLFLETLGGLLEQSESWEALVEVLQRLADVTSARGEQLALFHRLGGLLDERVSAPERAQQAFESALALDATHVPTLQALSRIYSVAEAWPELIAMHLAEAKHASDPRRRAAAHARVAEVLELRVGSPDDAMVHHGRALSLSPGYAPSFKALMRLYSDAGKYRELIELHERALESADEPAAKVSHLFKIGAIYEDSLGESGQAAHTYRRILEIEKGNLGALNAVQRASERAGRYAELVEALELEAEQRHDDGRIVDLLHRAAEVLDEHLNDIDGAMARYRRVLEIDKSHTPALAGLGRIYYRSGRWDDLLELYERELELDSKSTAGPALLHKMGQLAEERIGDELRAIDCYKRALDIDARHRPSIASLSRRLAARREWAELTAILELELDGLTEPNGRARAAFRLGEVHEHHMEAPDRAAAAYETALAAVPGYSPALSGLGRLRAQQGAWRRLVDQLEEEAAETDDEERKVARLARAGRLWSATLDDPRRAVGCYERALALEPGHLESLLALETLYRKLSRHDALRSVYGALARVLTDPRARVAALRELARSGGKHAPRPEEVRQILEAILSLVPNDTGALEGLEDLAIETEDSDLLVRVDQQLAATADDPRVGSTYQARLAASLEEASDEAALDAYRAALVSDPENIAAAKGLARVAEQLGDIEAIVDAAQREAAVTPDPERAAGLLVRAAVTRHRRLDDVEGALSDYERALELWPDDAGAAAGLSELLVATHQASRAAARLGRAAGSAKSAVRISGLWMEVARLQADLLDNVPGALSSLSRVLKGNPNHIPTLRNVAALKRRQGRWAEAAEKLTQVVSLAPSHDVLRDSHLELAEIWDEQLDEPSRALVSLQAVLSLDEENPSALMRLATLSARTGDPAKAAATLSRLVDASESSDKATALVQLSRVEEMRGDADAAIKAALSALALVGPNTNAADHHRGLVQSTDDWRDHAGAMRAWLRSSSDPLGRRTARLEIARIHAKELGDYRLAVAELVKGVKEQPTDVEMRHTLAVNMRLAGEHDDALAELRKLVHEHPARPALYRELAETHRSRGNVTAARRALTPLVLMGEASPEEIAEHRRRETKPAAAPDNALTAGIVEAFYPVRRMSGLSELLRHVTPAIGKVYPMDFDSYGVSSRDKMTSRSGKPIRKLAERVGAIFGVTSFNLYLHRGRPSAVSVELTDPPAVMLPAAVADLGEAHAVFALARAMSDIAVGLYAVDKLTPRELEIVLAAITRRVTPTFGAGLTAEETLDDLSKRLYKALARRARKGVDDMSQVYIDSGTADFALFVDNVTTAANRLALLTADDLLATVEVLRRTERDLAELSGLDLVRHPTVARLVRFWVSAEADSVRARCGH